MKANTPKKRFGQHFLIDTNILEEIIWAAHVKKGDPVLEIGPGEGVLTQYLVDKGAKVSAIEIDRDLVKHLHKRFAGQGNFHLTEADALVADWNEILPKDTKMKLVANLPYNVSTPLFFQFIAYKQHFQSFTIMLQKEVADRLMDRGDQKNKKDYGTLSIVSALHFDCYSITDVPPECFDPPPKVDSSVIQLIPKDTSIKQQKEFFSFLKTVFSMRRKIFGTSLRKGQPEFYENLSAETKERLGKIRPENLNPEEMLALFYEGQKIEGQGIQPEKKD